MGKKCQTPLVLDPLFEGNVLGASVLGIMIWPSFPWGGLAGAAVGAVLGFLLVKKERENK